MTSIGMNTRVSLGLVGSLLILAVGLVAQWYDMAGRFTALELQLELIRNEIDTKTADRWRATEDALFMRIFATENSLTMVPHPGDPQPKKEDK